MTRPNLAVLAATALLSSGTGAFAASLATPSPADAGLGDTRIVRELKAVNKSLERIDRSLGYNPQFPGSRSVRDSLKEICENGREFASTC